MRVQKTAKLCVTLLSIALISFGCGGGSGGGAGRAANRSGNGSGSGGGSVPMISGHPPEMIVAGATFEFQPQASDKDGDRLSFEIFNAPEWMDFDSSTGLLSGAPQMADIGVYEEISISVTDGHFTSVLRPFTLEVRAGGNLSITLSWSPPAENEDGTPLKDLAGYRIRYGIEPGYYSYVVDVASPGITTYVIESLLPGTYYLVMAAYNSEGVESEPSEEAQFTLR